MPRLISSAPAPASWTLTTVPGSLAVYTITLSDQDDEPFPVDGTTWSYVASISAGYSGTPVLSVTTTPSASGNITVSDPGTVVLTLYPQATASLSGSYKHSLWMNPGSPTDAFAWVTGSLSVQPTPPPD